MSGAPCSSEYLVFYQMCILGCVRKRENFKGVGYFLGVGGFSIGSAQRGCLFIRISIVHSYCRFGRYELGPHFQQDGRLQPKKEQEKLRDVWHFFSFWGGGIWYWLVVSWTHYSLGFLGVCCCWRCDRFVAALCFYSHFCLCSMHSSSTDRCACLSNAEQVQPSNHYLMAKQWLYPIDIEHDRVRQWQQWRQYAICSK